MTLFHNNGNWPRGVGLMKLIGLMVPAAGGCGTVYWLTTLAAAGLSSEPSAKTSHSDEVPWTNGLWANRV